MNVQIQINVCRACLSPSDDSKLTEFSQDSDLLKSYQDVICVAEPTSGLPRTFCEKCISKIKLCSSFKKSSLASENYLKSFVVRINQEFAKSLPSASTSQRNEIEDTDDPDAEIEQLLLEEKEKEPEESVSSFASQEPQLQHFTPTPPKVFKTEKPATTIKKVVKPPSMKVEKVTEAKAAIVENDSKEYMDVEPSDFTDEEQLDDDGNIFGEEIYDIMEIENEASDNIYLDETGKQVLGEEEGEFILVNFKSSNEDLADKDQQQFVVEELYDDEMADTKPAIARKKHVTRMPREIIDLYAHSTENNQHICTKCVKVFSTRTNLIRHIQSHDGHKAYVCETCNKGFTQSGSLKQHMYIHSGERPYKCQFCNRAFTQGKTLKFHLRRHTEEKPFICTECNSAFRQRDGLKRHLKSRHNIELKYDRHNQLHEKVIAFVNIDQDAGNNTEEKFNPSEIKPRQHIEIKFDKNNEKMISFAEIDQDVESGKVSESEIVNEGKKIE